MDLPRSGVTWSASVLAGRLNGHLASLAAGRMEYRKRCAVQSDEIARQCQIGIELSA
jgi:hypothetical protein